MPIFSNRSILRMLNAISPVIGLDRKGDLLARLVRDDESSLASEWEIAVLYCLWRQGSIRSLNPIEDRSDPDIIYRSERSNSEVVVEVTALSDRSLNDRNPIDDFDMRLREEFQRLGLSKVGGLNQAIGHVKHRDGPILAIPERKDFDRFFSNPKFKLFLEAIRSEPSRQHSFSFACRGANSRIDFIPNSRYSRGGFISPRVVTDISKNHLINRLKQKAKQLKKSNIALPAIVIVCDADSHFISSSTRGTGNVDAGDVADFFMTGRKHVQLGPWLVQKGKSPGSKRINAVQLWTLREEFNSSRRGPDARSARVTIIPNRGQAYHVLGEELCREVAASVKHLPAIVTMPVNALRFFSLPRFYGGCQMSFSKSGAFRVKLSLLSVQKLLSGELSSERFLSDHEDAARAIKNASGNRMISSVRVERQEDCDDDWIEITFGEITPNRLFHEEIKKTKQSKSLSFWRRTAMHIGNILVNWSNAERDKFS